MNKKLLEQLRTYGLFLFILIAAAMLFYFVLFRGAVLAKGIAKINAVIAPIVYGFVLAYILTPVMQQIEQLLLRILVKLNFSPKRRGMSILRVISAILSVLCLVIVIYALIALLLPELLNSIRSITYSFPVYVENIRNWINTYINNPEIDVQSTELLNEFETYVETFFSEKMNPYIDTVMQHLSDSLREFVVFFSNTVVGLIVSVYIMINGERTLARFRRFMYAVLPIPTANRIIVNIRMIDEKFGGFILGKLIDSLIIGILCYICCKIIHIPYQSLIAVIIGVTNIIPFFGPFIGAVPTAFLVLCVDPIKALYFIILVFALQQFDGNILGPAILGSSVGVSSFMVLVSILIGSGFLGVVGMIIAVPMAAVITSFAQSYVLRFLDNKNLPDSLESYNHLDHVDPTTRNIVSEKDPSARQSLYTRLKRRNALYQEYEQPLELNQWDLTIDEIRAEYSELMAERKAEEEFKKKMLSQDAGDDVEEEPAPVPETEQDISTQ